MRILSSLLAGRIACYNGLMEIIIKSAIETKKFAREMAAKIDRLAASWTRQGAIIIGLQGELGSGKTMFVQGFLGYFGIRRATSPTFVIIKKYSYKNPKANPPAGGQNPNKVQNPPPFLAEKAGQAKSKFQTPYLYHIDCYRIKNSRDLSELGLEEIIGNPRNIVLIEWAERIYDILPRDAIWIEFRHKSENERVLKISPLTADY